MRERFFFFYEYAKTGLCEECKDHHHAETILFVCWKFMMYEV